LEVQERACILNNFVNLVTKVMEENKEKIPGVSDELESIFSEVFKPVSKEAILHVPIPDGLDLDAWISEPLPPEEPTDEGLTNSLDNDLDWNYGMRDNDNDEKHSFEDIDVNERMRRVDEMKKKLSFERWNDINILKDEPDGMDEPNINNDYPPMEQHHDDEPEGNQKVQNDTQVENRRPRINQPRQQVKVDIEGDEDLPEWKEGKGEKPPVKTKSISDNPLALVDLNDDEEPILLVRQEYPSTTQGVQSPEERREESGSPRGSPKGERGSPRGERGMRRVRRGRRPRGRGTNRGDRGRPQ